MEDTRRAIDAAGAGSLTVGQVMTQKPVTLGPEDTLSRGNEVMRAHRIRRILIVAGDTLVGLLAEGDLKRAQPSTLSASQEDYDRVMDGTPVSRIMITKLVTVTEDTPLLEAARILYATKYGALPVIRDGKAVGILTDSDLHRVLVELLAAAG
jgi:acetoin utilization protein AcuB